MQGTAVSRSSSYPRRLAGSVHAKALRMCTSEGVHLIQLAEHSCAHPFHSARSNHVTEVGELEGTR